MPLVSSAIEVLGPSWRLHRSPRNTRHYLLGLEPRRLLHQRRHEEGSPLELQVFGYDDKIPQKFNRGILNPKTQQKTHETNIFFETAPPAPPLPPFSHAVAHQSIVRRLLHSVQSQSTHEIFGLLEELAEGLADPTVQHELHSLPPATFSEILLSLDPMRIQHQVDSSNGFFLSPGSLFLPSAYALVDEYGLRRVYLALFRKLFLIFRVRAETGQPVLVSDFVVLLRCAGTTSQPANAKRVWALMEELGMIELRQGEIVTEFIKARFLTEPIYYQFDATRVRVRPSNLHNQGRSVGVNKRHKLDVLKHSARTLQWHQFGMDPTHESQTRDTHRIFRLREEIRKILPISRLQYMGVSEDLVCSAMIASCRSGSSHYMRLLLRQCFGIAVHVDKKTGRISVSGGTIFKPGSTRKPTGRLLEAIIEGLGCNAEMALAVHLVGYVSELYAIPITDKMWSSLLQWAYIHASKPAAREWKILGDPWTIVFPRQVSLIYETMTSERYGAQPTFHDKARIATLQITRAQTSDALHTLREMKHLYEDAVSEHEKAVYQQLASYIHDVPTQHSGKALVVREQYWYTLQLLCRRWIDKVGNLSRARRNGRGDRPMADDHLMFSRLPHFIEEFDTFMPQKIQYLTPAGSVSIENAAKGRLEWRNRLVLSPTSRIWTSKPYTKGNEQSQALTRPTPEERRIMIRPVKKARKLKHGIDLIVDTIREARTRGVEPDAKDILGFRTEILRELRFP